MLAFSACASFASAPAPARRPLTSADIDDISRLVMLEDTRRFDEAALARMLRSAHPEVRRRAALAVGRIVDERGRALLAAARTDADVDVAASVAFATGQIKDPAAVPWLSDLLASRKTPAASAPVVSEALFAIGRFTTREDLAPIVRWTTSPDALVRWHAAWALFRPRDPDRRVRIAALRSLVQYDDDASFDVVVAALARRTPGSRCLPQRHSADFRLVRSPSVVARTSAVQALQRLGAPGRARLDALSADPDIRALLPQPHNEGDFTAPGRVIAGMDIVDRLELGDRVTAARMRR
jgi:HEAT repeat protein